MLLSAHRLLEQPFSHCLWGSLEDILDNILGFSIYVIRLWGSWNTRMHANLIAEKLVYLDFGCLEDIAADWFSCQTLLCTGCHYCCSQGTKILCTSSHTSSSNTWSMHMQLLPALDNSRNSLDHAYIMNNKAAMWSSIKHLVLMSYRYLSDFLFQM